MFSPLFLSYFSGLILSLSRAAHARLTDALADSTNRTYIAMFRLYLAFLAFNGLAPSQVMVDISLAFFECLRYNNISYSQMLNYLSAIKSVSVRFSLDISHFQHPKISLFLKAVQKSTPRLLRMTNLIHKSFLFDIVTKCRSTHMGHIFKTAYLLGFFGFLRLSNLVPHSCHTFSHLKHLAKGDIFFCNSYANILIKWSKTMQLGNQARLLKLPRLNNDICPYSALKNCIQLVPGGNNKPLLQINVSGKWIPLTDNRVRRHLREILGLLNKDPSFITFHSFRRSGATFAFNHNVPLQDIQRHGTWTSDAVWHYVTDSTNVGCQVADTFATQLS